MNDIAFHSVTKEYKNHVKALNSVSFSVDSGVFGLLGHNVRALEDSRQQGGQKRFLDVF